MIGVSTVVVRDGDRKVHDRIWDFGFTIFLLHIILSAAIGGGPVNGQWWGTVVAGALINATGGYFASNWYWGMIAQARLDGKVNALN